MEADEQLVDSAMHAFPPHIMQPIEDEEALKEAEQALTAYAAELDRHKALAAASQLSDDAFRLAKIQYENGATSQLDLLTTEGNTIAAHQALAASDQQLAADQVAVFQALGGGWEQAPVARP